MPDLIKPQMGKPEQQKGEKQPSKFFTEYYGAAFLFLIALFVIVALLFLKPVIDDIKQVNAETQTELKNAENERAYLDSLESSINAAQNISSDVLDRVTQALPAEANIPSLLVQFGSAAYANGIQVNSLSFSENKAPAKAAGAQSAPVQPVDITLTIQAPSYFDFKRFLSDIETSLRVMDVLGMTTGGGADHLSFTLQLRTYVFGTPPASLTAIAPVAR